VVNAPPPTFPPLFVPKTETGELITRKNEPVVVVEYEVVDDLFAREEPALRKLEFGKEGQLGMTFSNEMVYPDSW